MKRNNNSNFTNKVEKLKKSSCFYYDSFPKETITPNERSAPDWVKSAQNMLLKVASTVQIVATLNRQEKSLFQVPSHTFRILMFKNQCFLNLSWLRVKAQCFSTTGNTWKILKTDVSKFRDKVFEHFEICFWKSKANLNVSSSVLLQSSLYLEAIASLEATNSLTQ